jgi:hypothetical protein
MAGYKAPDDAVLLPASFVAATSDIAEAAGRLADRAQRMGEKTAVLFNEHWLVASPPRPGSTVAIEAARAVMWWEYDTGIEREDSWRGKAKKLEDEIAALKARIADLEK